MGKAVRAGDVFAIPIAEGRWGFGLVIRVVKQSALFLGVFDFEAELPEVDLPSLAQEPWLLMALSLDAKLWNGDWPVVGNLGPVDDMGVWPRYIVKVGERHLVEDFDGNIIREASASDHSTLRTRFGVSPARIQLALAASRGVGQWRDSYDDLTIARVRRWAAS